MRRDLHLEFSSAAWFRAAILYSLAEVLGLPPSDTVIKVAARIPMKKQTELDEHFPWISRSS
jgi:hypothetical protein